MWKKKILVSLLATGAFALTACTTNDGAMDTTTPDVEEQEETIVSENEYKNIKVSPEEAFDTYMEKHPDTKVKKVHLDKDLGKYVYSVEGFEGNMEYEIKIDPIDGSITKEYSETDNDMDSMELTRENVEKVMPIVEEALAEAGPDAKLEEWTVEMDDGRTQLEIEIDKKGFDNEERTYDVETGELVEIDN